MATNYVIADPAAALAANTDLPPNIVSKILKSLGGGNVDTVEIGPTDALSFPKGTDLVVVEKGGSFNLSSLSKGAINNLDALIFDTKEDVNLTLTGKKAKAFDGVIATSDGDDKIIVKSDKKVTISSGDGNDTIVTGKGNDTVSTGAGNDSVNTGAGNDSVNVGSGNDTIKTGSGNDTVKLDALFTGSANIDGGSGNNDKLNLTNVGIENVSQTGSGAVKITLDNGSVVTADNFEKFVYDSNGAADGGVKVVGVDPFIDAF